MANGEPTMWRGELILTINTAHDPARDRRYVLGIVADRDRNRVLKWLRDTKDQLCKYHELLLKVSDMGRSCFTFSAIREDDDGFDGFADTVIVPFRLIESLSYSYTVREDATIENDVLRIEPHIGSIGKPG